MLESIGPVIVVGVLGLLIGRRWLGGHADGWVSAGEDTSGLAPNLTYLTGNHRRSEPSHGGEWGYGGGWGLDGGGAGWGFDGSSDGGCGGDGGGGGGD